MKAIINNELSCEKPALDLGTYYSRYLKKCGLLEGIGMHILLYMLNNRWEYFYNFTFIGLLNEVYIYSKRN